jgi:hypothetical protein
MRVPLLKPLKHLIKQNILLSEQRGELVHISVRRLAF